MATRVVIPGFRKIETSGGGEGGTTNYEDLTNKPFINDVPLVGNLNTADLKLTDSTLAEEGVPADSKTVGEKLNNIGFETGSCTLIFGKFNETAPNTLLESCEVTGMYIKVGKMCFISLSGVKMEFSQTYSTTGNVIVTGGIPYPAANPANVLGYLTEDTTPFGTKNLITYWEEESNASAPPQFADVIKVGASMIFCLEAIYEIAD